MLHEIMGWILFLENTKNIIIWGAQMGPLLTSRLPLLLSLSPRPMRGYHSTAVAGQSNSSSSGLAIPKTLNVFYKIIIIIINFKIILIK
jgi:hypothetical protein